MEAWELLKTNTVIQCLERLRSQIERMHLGNRLLEKFEQYIAECEATTTQMKVTHFSEACQALQQQQAYTTAKNKTWKKRQIEPELTEQPCKKQRKQSSDENVICLTGTGNAEVEHTDITWLCSDGHWD